MEQIKVNDYVRTKKGQIDIFKEYGYERTCVRCENKKYFTSDITKHSPNIIDLIEVGDYVNGYPVRKINGVLCNFDLNNMKWAPLKEIDVWGDIATHEQFNSIKYEVN